LIFKNTGSDVKAITYIGSYYALGKRRCHYTDWPSNDTKQSLSLSTYRSKFFAHRTQLYSAFETLI